MCVLDCAAMQEDSRQFLELFVRYLRMLLVGLLRRGCLMIGLVGDTSGECRWQ